MEDFFFFHPIQNIGIVEFFRNHMRSWPSLYCDACRALFLFVRGFYGNHRTWGKNQKTEDRCSAQQAVSVAHALRYYFFTE
jgi:hypothetical protein